MPSQYKSPLHQMALTTPTDFWNDSCSPSELSEALDHGAVGATSNPVIVYNVLKNELPTWRPRLLELIHQNPTWSESVLAWKIFEEVTLAGARLLLPVFEQHQGLKGRMSIQTDPANYRNTAAQVEQALRFHRLAPNMQVKLVVTQAGLQAIEEATYQGITITATVCFTVAQSIAVAEAVERGLQRRSKEGKETAHLIPVCAFMIGRTDDWIRLLIQRDQLDLPAEYAGWAGLACLKNAYQLYRQRGYRTRLLAAAFRSVRHWSELAGGDLVLTIPLEWQRKINASGIELRDRMQEPIPPEVFEALYRQVPDFRRAYEPEGLQIEEFEGYGATLRTMRSFIGAMHDLTGLVRDVMLPDPDIR